MVKRFIYSFLGIIGYMVICALIILPVILMEGSLAPEVFAATMIIWSAFIVLSFLPAFAFIIHLFWRFKGEEGAGLPVPMDSLKLEIMDINKYDVPVMVEERKSRGSSSRGTGTSGGGKSRDDSSSRGGEKSHLVLTWRYVDSKWWEILAKAGLQKTYELHVKLNDQKKKATLIDVTKTISWSAGPTKANISWAGFRGVIFALEIGKQWGIRENFTLGKIHDYRFNPSEIKTPVMNTILRRGWDVEFGLI